MTNTVTAVAVEAYSFCPRKAFLLMTGEPSPEPHEYVRMTDEQAGVNRQAHRARLALGNGTFGGARRHGVNG